MTSIAGRHWDRQTVLLAMCHAAEGATNVLFNPSEVRAILGWDDDRFTLAAKWVADHQLIRQPDASDWCQMTPEGVEVTQAVIRTTDEPPDDRRSGHDL